MSLRTRGCANNPNNFCYICGSFVAKAQRQNETKFVQNVYYAYFEIKHGLHIKSVVAVLNHCVDGAMESKKVWHLVSRWCRKSQRHMEMNAISAVAMFLDSMQKINITFFILIYHLQLDLSFMDQMSLYQQLLQF